MISQLSKGVMVAAMIAVMIAANSLSATPVSRQSARAYLMRWEGYRSIPYRDGHQTCVGIGHPLRGPVKNSYGHEEIDAFFTSDLARARAICRNGISRFNDLPENAQLVAIGVVFTVGPTGFQRFTRFRNSLSSRKFGSAAMELKRSNWWVQVGDNRARDSWRRLMESD